MPRGIKEDTRHRDIRLECDTALYKAVTSPGQELEQACLGDLVRPGFHEKRCTGAYSIQQRVKGGSEGRTRRNIFVFAHKKIFHRVRVDSPPSLRFRYATMLAALGQEPGAPASPTASNSAERTLERSSVILMITLCFTIGPVPAHPKHVCVRASLSAIC